MIHPDLGVFGDLSDATLRLLRAVQGSSALCDALDRLRDGWTREALVHGDIKWENWLVAGGATGGRQPRLKLVDWEFADLGDPCWDVGSVFADYLTLWLFSIPITGEQPPDRFLELARYPLERIQPALRAFWRVYVGRMGLDAAAADRALRRATAYGAARLVQSAFERTQVSFRLTGDLLYVVQLALNMLQRPQEAIVHLLGIALDG
jgi:aminoglycoside phosphotransferase (APT) family kinase protein